MNGKMGLLSDFQGQTSVPATPSTMGGLLGDMGGMQATQSTQNQGGDMAKQLATMLMQSPTPETVSTIIKQLQGSQMPDADKWTQFLPTIANNPEQLKQVATMVLNG
jgi:hypothetical protein